MKIYVQRIPEGGILLESEESPEIVGEVDPRVTFPEKIFARINAYKFSGNLIVGGSLSTHVNLTCSRCADIFSYPIEVKDFSYDCEVLGRDIIDLTEPIREYIIIGLPIKPLCSIDCKGLCTRCGQNLNLLDCKCRKNAKVRSISKLGDLF